MYYKLPNFNYYGKVLISDLLRLLSGATPINNDMAESTKFGFPMKISPLLLMRIKS